jgi:predicted lactoylglutathione lyase
VAGITAGIKNGNDEFIDYTAGSKTISTAITVLLTRRLTTNTFGNIIKTEISDAILQNELIEKPT